MSEQTYKINVSVKFKSTKGVRRFVIRADNFQGLHDAFTTEMKKVAPTATAVYWTDGDGDKVYMESVSELEEAYHLSAAPNNNLLNLIVDEEMKKDPETTSTSSQESQTKAKVTMPMAQDYTGCLHNAICDLCDSPIIGHRFRCLMCNDFDLCGPCESTGAHSEHAMLRIVDPDVTRIPWGAKLSHDCQRLYQGLDEQLRQTQPSHNKQFTNIKNQGINMLMEVGNVLQTTLANFGIEASYEVRNPGDQKERKEKKEEPAAAEKPVVDTTVPTAPAPEVPNAPPQESTTEKTKVHVVKKAPKAEANTVLKKTTEAKQVAYVATAAPKKSKPEIDFEKLIQGVNEAGAYVAIHGPALPTQMSTHERSRRAQEAKKAIEQKQNSEARPTNQIAQQDNKTGPKVATGIFATANRRSIPPPPKNLGPAQEKRIPPGLFKTQPTQPGLFATAQAASPRVSRDREHERRRDNTHRPERYDYHSDESAGRSPSPPRFAGVRGVVCRNTDPVTVNNATNFEDFFKAKMASNKANRDRENEAKRKESEMRKAFGGFAQATPKERLDRNSFYQEPGFGSSAFGNSRGFNPGVTGGFGDRAGNTNGFAHGGFGDRSSGFGSSQFGRSGFVDFGSGFSGNAFSGNGFGSSSSRGFGFTGRNYNDDSFQVNPEFGKHPYGPRDRRSAFEDPYGSFRICDDDSDDAIEVKPNIVNDCRKKSAFKNVTETAKKPEPKIVRKMSPKEAIEIINAKRVESRNMAAKEELPKTENVATSVSLTNYQVEIEKKEDAKVADATTVEQEKVSETSNATVAVPVVEQPAPNMAVVPYVENETVTETVDAATAPEVAPEVVSEVPETTDAQSIGSEVEQIEDCDSDGWVDAKEASEAMIANASAVLDSSLSTSTSATVPTPRENVYPSLMQEEASIGGQAREDTFAKLLTMGFSDIEARRAIAHCGCDVWNCVEYINMQQ